ncbi:MAG: hypothetical protein GX593_02460 [Actinomycetales bacterium]|nr:hypothetical protein [Actinomycetales bacterium]
MTQQLVEPPGPTEPVARNVTVSLLDVSALTPEVRRLLRDQGRLTAVEAAEFYGPARLPHPFTADEARTLVAALERLGIAARSEEPGQVWQSPDEEPPLDIVQHAGVREHY